MGNIRNTKLPLELADGAPVELISIIASSPRPTTGQLPFEARKRIARQIGESSRISVVAFGDAIAAERAPGG